MGATVESDYYKKKILISFLDLKNIVYIFLNNIYIKLNLLLQNYYYSEYYYVIKISFYFLYVLLLYLTISFIVSARTGPNKLQYNEIFKKLLDQIKEFFKGIFYTPKEKSESNRDLIPQPVLKPRSYKRTLKHIESSCSQDNLLKNILWTSLYYGYKIVVPIGIIISSSFLYCFTLLFSWTNLLLTKLFNIRILIDNSRIDSFISFILEYLPELFDASNIRVFLPYSFFIIIGTTSIIYKKQVYGGLESILKFNRDNYLKLVNLNQNILKNLNQIILKNLKSEITYNYLIGKKNQIIGSLVYINNYLKGKETTETTLNKDISDINDKLNATFIKWTTHLNDIKNSSEASIKTSLDPSKKLVSDLKLEIKKKLASAKDYLKSKKDLFQQNFESRLKSFKDHFQNNKSFYKDILKFLELDSLEKIPSRKPIVTDSKPILDEKEKIIKNESNIEQNTIEKFEAIRSKLKTSELSENLGIIGTSKKINSSILNNVKDIKKSTSEEVKENNIPSRIVLKKKNNQLTTNIVSSPSDQLDVPQEEKYLDNLSKQFSAIFRDMETTSQLLIKFCALLKTIDASNWNDLGVLYEKNLLNPKLVENNTYEYPLLKLAGCYDEDIKFLVQTFVKENNHIQVRLLPLVSVPKTDSLRIIKEEEYEQLLSKKINFFTQYYLVQESLGPIASTPEELFSKKEHEKYLIKGEIISFFNNFCIQKLKFEITAHREQKEILNFLVYFLFCYKTYELFLGTSFYNEEEIPSKIHMAQFWKFLVPRKNRNKSDTHMSQNNYYLSSLYVNNVLGSTISYVVHKLFFNILMFQAFEIYLNNVILKFTVFDLESFSSLGVYTLCFRIILSVKWSLLLKCLFLSGISYYFIETITPRIVIVLKDKFDLTFLYQILKTNYSKSSSYITLFTFWIFLKFTEISRPYLLFFDNFEIPSIMYSIPLGLILCVTLGGFLILFSLNIPLSTQNVTPSEDLRLPGTEGSLPSSSDPVRPMANVTFLKPIINNYLKKCILGFINKNIFLILNQNLIKIKILNKIIFLKTNLIFNNNLLYTIKKLPLDLKTIIYGAATAGGDGAGGGTANPTLVPPGGGADADAGGAAAATGGVDLTAAGVDAGGDGAGGGTANPTLVPPGGGADAGVDAGQGLGIINADDGARSSDANRQKTQIIIQNILVENKKNTEEEQKINRIIAQNTELETKDLKAEENYRKENENNLFFIWCECKNELLKVLLTFYKSVVFIIVFSFCMEIFCKFINSYKNTEVLGCVLDVLKNYELQDYMEKRMYSPVNLFDNLKNINTYRLRPESLLKLCFVFLPPFLELIALFVLGFSNYIDYRTKFYMSSNITFKSSISSKKIFKLCYDEPYYRFSLNKNLILKDVKDTSADTILNRNQAYHLMINRLNEDIFKEFRLKFDFFMDGEPEVLWDLDKLELDIKACDKKSKSFNNQIDKGKQNDISRLKYASYFESEEDLTTTLTMPLLPLDNTSRKTIREYLSKHNKQTFGKNKDYAVKTELDKQISNTTKMYEENDRRRINDGTIAWMPAILWKIAELKVETLYYNLNLKENSSNISGIEKYLSARRLLNYYKFLDLCNLNADGIKTQNQFKESIILYYMFMEEFNTFNSLLEPKLYSDSTFVELLHPTIQASSDTTIQFNKLDEINQISEFNNKIVQLIYSPIIPINLSSLENLEQNIKKTLPYRGYKGFSCDDLHLLQKYNNKSIEILPSQFGVDAISTNVSSEDKIKELNKWALLWVYSCIEMNIHPSNILYSVNYKDGRTSVGKYFKIDIKHRLYIPTYTRIVIGSLKNKEQIRSIVKSIISYINIEGNHFGGHSSQDHLLLSQPNFLIKLIGVNNTQEKNLKIITFIGIGLTIMCLRMSMWLTFNWLAYLLDRQIVEIMYNQIFEKGLSIMPAYLIFFLGHPLGVLTIFTSSWNYYPIINKNILNTIISQLTLFRLISIFSLIPHINFFNPTTIFSKIISIIIKIPYVIAQGVVQGYNFITVLWKLLVLIIIGLIIITIFVQWKYNSITNNLIQMLQQKLKSDFSIKDLLNLNFFGLKNKVS